MSNINTLLRLGGAPAPIDRMSEEEKASLRQKPELKPRPKLPEKSSQGFKGFQPRPARTQNPLEGAGRVVRKINNEYQWATKTAGNALGNVIRGAAGKAPVTVEQAEQAERQRRATGKQTIPDKINTITRPVSDLKKAIGGGVVRSAEGVIGGGAFLGDLIQMKTDKVLRRPTDPSRNPFHPKYVEPRLDTGIAVPNTAGGRLGQGLISLIGTGAWVTARLPQATTKVGALVRGEVGGVVADLLMTRKGDSNLTALVRDVMPEEWQDSVLFFLASDKDDTAVSARLKNALEGAGLGFLMGGLAGLRVAKNTPLTREAVSKLPGGEEIAKKIPEGKVTPEEELSLRTEIYNRYIDQDANVNLDNAAKEAGRFDEINLRLLDDAELEAPGSPLDIEAADAATAPRDTDADLDAGQPQTLRRPQEEPSAAAEGVPPARATEEGAPAAPVAPAAARAADEATGPQALETAPFRGGTEEVTARPTEAPRAPEAPETVRPEPGEAVPSTTEPTWPSVRGAAQGTTQTPGFTQRDIQAGIQERIDLGYSPQDFSLLPQERAASFNPTSFDVALKSDYPTTSLTDAQVKWLRWDDKVEDTISDFGSNPKVRETLANPGPEDKQIISEAYEAMNRIKEASGEKDFYAVPDPTKSFEEQGLIKIVKNKDDTETRIFSDPGIIASRIFFRDLGDRAWRLSKQMADLAEEGKPMGNTTDKMLDSLIGMLQLGKRTQEMSQGTSRAWGLPLDQAKGTTSLATEVNGTSGFDEAISKVRSIQEAITAGREDLVRDDLNILGAMLRASDGNPEKVLSFWKLARTVGIKDMGTNMIQSIFSGTVTQTRNLVGNSYTAIERPTSALIYSMMKGDIHSARMALSGYRAAVQALPEAWQLAKAAMRGQDTSDLRYTDTGKYVRLEANTVDSLKELLARANTPAEKAAANFLNLQHKFITTNPLFDYGTRLLTSGDEAFQHLAARQWAAMDSMYKASSTTGSTREAYEKFTREFDTTKFAPDGRIIDPELKKWVSNSTFQTEPWQFVQDLSGFLNSVPILKWFVPVVNTPAEILRYELSFAPGINKKVLADYRDVASKAEMGDLSAQAKKAVYDGRVGLGTIVAGSGFVYAMSGNLTGFGPPPGSREWRAWQLTNKKPMHIRIGDTWYDYSSIPMVSTFLGVAGDAAMLINTGVADAGHNLMAQLAFTGAATFTDKLALRSLNDLMTVLDPRSDPETARGVLLGLVNNTLPSSGLRRSLYYMFNPIRKEYESQTHRLWAVATAGLVDKGSVFIDPLTGQPELSYLGGFYNANSPIRVAPENMDPLKWQLEKDGFGYVNNKKGPHGLKLTPEDQQKIHKIMFDIGLREVMETTVTDPRYREVADVWDERSFDPDEPSEAPPHLAVLQRQWNKVRQQAIGILFDRDPVFAESVTQQKEARQSFRRGETATRNSAFSNDLNSLLQAPK
jgi:hypothetical protein